MTRRFARAAALLALLLAAPAGAQTPGLGRDDTRRPVPPDRAPWNAVGMVEAPGNQCTGVLVGPRSVATAAHCLIKGAEPVQAQETDDGPQGRPVHEQGEEHVAGGQDGDEPLHLRRDGGILRHRQG